jgi:hypothetical protein
MARPGWPHPAATASQGNWPAATAPTATGYAPAPTTTASGTTQQLTSPWVIIPSSSAPVSGQVPGSPSPSGITQAGSMQQSVVTGYAPSLSSPAGISIPHSYSAQPQQVFSAGGQQVFSAGSQQVLSAQPQQVFMMNQPAQPRRFGSLLHGHSHSRPSYRTVWYRIPTTNFRPVAAVDPCTGATTTVMRPCTTYSWQARRVPTMRSPSLCERILSCFHRPPPPVLPAAPMSVMTGYACDATCPPVSAAGSAAPYYAPPATSPAVGSSGPYGGTTLPATGYPSGTYPSSGGAIPGGTVPSGVVPGTSAPSRGEPADYPPTLEPRRYPPDENSWPEDAREDDDLSSGSAASYATPHAGRTPLRAPRLDKANSSISRGGEREASPESRRLELNPVPDPDALFSSPDDVEPPQLLNPKDRRASQAVHRAGDYVLVSWGDVTRSEGPSAAPITPPRSDSRPTVEKRAEPPANDSGWRTSAK